jgi:hypothetical protein
MSVGAFTDTQHAPTPQQILAMVGRRQLAWENLTQFVREKYACQEDFGFYGKNYGWAVRFRRSGKALISLYPAKDSFTVQIILSETAVAQALTLKIGQHVRRILEAAHPYAEGRWLFIPVKTVKDIKDIQLLLGLKGAIDRR